jgi:CheY-like chemotaxis protein
MTPGSEPDCPNVPPPLPNLPAPADNRQMVRPCFLVIDREYSGSISTRKLVIETAKFNVITSYSAAEALETLRMFPNLHGVVLDAGIRDMTCCDLVAQLKHANAALPIVVISAPGTHECPQADHLLESFQPAKLLMLLQSLVPVETAAIEKRNEELTERLP